MEHRVSLIREWTFDLQGPIVAPPLQFFLKGSSQQVQISRIVEKTYLCQWKSALKNSLIATSLDIARQHLSSNDILNKVLNWKESKHLYEQRWLRSVQVC